MSIIEPKSPIAPGEERKWKVEKEPKLETHKIKHENGAKQPHRDYRKPQGGGNRNLG